MNPREGDAHNRGDERANSVNAHVRHVILYLRRRIYINVCMYVCVCSTQYTSSISDVPHNDASLTRCKSMPRAMILNRTSLNHYRGISITINNEV